MTLFMSHPRIPSATIEFSPMSPSNLRSCLIQLLGDHIAVDGFLLWSVSETGAAKYSKVCYESLFDGRHEIHKRHLCAALEKAVVEFGLSRARAEVRMRWVFSVH